MAYSNLTGLPSVTTILKPFINTDYFTEAHSERGTLVHAACNAHINGAYVPPMATEHQPYFDSFRRWADVSIDTVMLSEERLVDEALGYCGQFDLVAVLKGDRCFTVIDLKTSQAFYDWFAIQLAGYAHLIVEAKEMVVARRLSVLLKNDGTGCKIREYHGETHWNVFKSALNCYKYFNKGA